MQGRSLTALVALLWPGASAVSPNLKGHQADEVTSLVQTDLQRSRITISTPQVQQHLIVCNAYDSSSPLEILHEDQQVLLTRGKPLAYKECSEFMLPLMEGDRLDFKSNGQEVGIFHATSMPKVATSLLLIPHRRKTLTKSMAFQSHAFADLQSPQIAVVDVYRGKETGAVNLIESPEGHEEPLTEELSFSSVVAVNPGKYKIALKGSQAAAPQELEADDKAKYVAMRIGGGTQNGVALPQELVIFKSFSMSRYISVTISMVVAVLLLAFLDG